MCDEQYAARSSGHATLAAWLGRIHAAGNWTRYHSEPRYNLVVLRRIAARGWARRERAFHGKEDVMEFLFPGDPPPRGDKQAKRHLRLPDDLFPLVARYYWGGGLSAEEEAAAASEALAAR